MSTAFIDYCLNHEKVINHTRQESYKKGDVIETIGTRIREIGIVNKGLLKTVNYSAEGKELNTTLFFTNSILLEYLYFNDNLNYTYDLVVLRPTTVTWIPTKIFKSVVFEDSLGMELYVHHLIERGLESQRIIACLNYPTIRERICYWIASKNSLEIGRSDIKPDMELPFTQEIFAKLIKVSRASLNQELHRMEDEGFFTMTRKALTQINQEKIWDNL